MSYSRKDVLAYNQSEAGQEAQAELNRMLVRSATDMEFRKKLINSPAEAFAEHGTTVPEGWDIRFVENHADATIVLPDVVDPAAELSEAELEAVAGGVLIIFVSSTACAAVASAAVSYLTAKL